MQIFFGVKQPDIMAWSTLISAYSMQGDWETSFQLFNSLLQSGLTPISITFTHLLSAASHSGKVTEALEIYKSMESYGVTPTSIHAHLIVDVFSRSGRFQEAVDFIETNNLGSGIRP